MENLGYTILGRNEANVDKNWRDKWWLLKLENTLKSVSAHFIFQMKKKRKDAGGKETIKTAFKIVQELWFYGLQQDDGSKKEGKCQR